MISIENLFFSYTGHAPFILSDLNLSLDRGEYVSIMGENGCGKSTLIRLILGFLDPVSGIVATDATRISYLPQKKDAVENGFPITVGEVLNSYAHLLKLSDKKRVDEVLSKVGMLHEKRSLLSQLSGGQVQKVLLARAVLGEAELLVLDEPSTGLDPESQKDIYTLLREMNQTRGITIISVEHNLEAAIANSTLIYHLDQGHGHLCSPNRYRDEFLRVSGVHH
ncbi:MAG: metal ABC transporter ATP-binding protein [Anaerolineaceae bacterium]|nr:metal ABC transporter ATP-binding protein [Anaerolineaceae bacterium]